MDERVLRAQLEEIDARMTRTRKELEMLTTARAGIGTLMELYGYDRQPAPQFSFEPAANGVAGQEHMPLRRAIVQVIREANGEPIHARDILEGVRALGADSGAKNPENAVDWAAYSLMTQGRREPIERVDGLTKTWRWVGDGAHATEHATVLKKEAAVPGRRGGRPKGRVGMEAAVVAVLREARGEPLRTRDILPRVVALGAITEAKNPMGVVDMTANGLMKDGKEPVRKAGPRLWRWAGPLDEKVSHPGMFDGEEQR